jgi:hypothetical protein
MGGRRGSAHQIKLALAGILIVLADQLFYGRAIGSTLGGFALMLVLTVLAVHPAVRENLRARWTLVAALGFALVQIESPTVLGWALFWTALAVSVVLPRVAPGGDILRWLRRLSFLVVAGLTAPLRDLIRAERSNARRRGGSHRSLAVLVLPLVGAAVFVTLFAVANPVVGWALRDLWAAGLDPWRVLFWLATLVGAWMFLRPRIAGSRQRAASVPWRATAPGVGVASVTLCLISFNVIFAVENGLDLVFLWSGARLPAGVTFADYAHRGAYTLIATALLAALFVLIALRPGSATARAPWPRRLMTLWVAQNLLLVASSMLRVVDYVSVYSLTGLRIAALIWMALVGVGLVLVCVRLFRGATANWLISANALAAGLVLAVCSGVDLNAVAAEWNVSHAREVGGGVPLDLCYLSSLGDAALVPLSELELRHLPLALHEKVVQARIEAYRSLALRQGQWRGWTWRGQRRLERSNALVTGPGVTPVGGSGYRPADGARSG